jgi:uncharacterized protein YceK
VKLSICVILILLLAGCGTTSDQTQSNPYEGKFETYNIPFGKLLIDKETGCHYIRGTYGESSYIPRLTSEGKPMCKAG